jgi:MFS family permease
VFGSFFGSWAVAVIDVERAFRLSDAQIGFILAGGILAATGIATVGGLVIDRWGASLALVRSLIVWGALLGVSAAAPHLGVFAPALVLALAAGGAVDVVMNVIAADALASEPGQLVRFHGLYNAGAVIGAAVTGIALRFGASWRAVWIGISAVAIVLALTTRRARLPEPPTKQHPSTLRAVAELRHEGLLVLALVFGASAMVEGGIATWGVLYLRGHLGLGVLAGVTAYITGMTLATLARFGGGPIVSAIGSRRAVVIGAALTAGGLAVEAVSGVPALAAAGLAAAAVGISVVWPLLIAAVNNEARHPVLAIGGVTACGYLGMVAGPPLVGTLSGAFGLRTGLLVLAGIALFVAVTPARIRPRTAVARAARG